MHIPERESRVREAFERFDEGAKGFLTRHEFKCAAVAVTGHKPSKFELCHFFGNSVLQEENSGFDLEQLSTFIAAEVQHQHPEDHIRQVFKAFDIRGTIWIQRLYD